jgi:hypothetical protein
LLLHVNASLFLFSRNKSMVVGHKWWAVTSGAEMKQPLLGAMAGLAFVGSSLTAHAVPFDFTYTGSLVTFTVPTTDTYQILAYGAQGGNAVFPLTTGPGGLGAEIGGDFSLTAGEVLQIAVGGAGSNENGTGGGGGGSFVVGPGNTPLVIAGGGGGGGVIDPQRSTPLAGGGGLTGQNGGSGVNGNGGTGGNGGGGGFGSFGGGGGGGGFFSAGGAGEFFGTPVSGGGGAFPGLAGGLVGGGFGGGGGASGGGGGGGGYSGGGGGTSSPGGNGPGGGGGSFDAGADQILVADFRTGNGEVVISEGAIPEPASIALLGAGLVSLAALRRRRRANTPAE